MKDIEELVRVEPLMLPLGSAYLWIGNHAIHYDHAHEAVADRNSVREEIAAAVREAVERELVEQRGEE